MFSHGMTMALALKETGAPLLRCCILCAIALLLLLLPSAGSATSDKLETEILRLINEIRAEAGVPPLESNAELAPVATLRAREITRKFSHERPNGKQWASALTDCNVVSRYAGENLAYGFSSAADVVGAWMESKSHRRNILDSRYNTTALSRKKVDGTVYWCQVFVESANTSLRTASSENNARGRDEAHRNLPPKQGIEAIDDKFLRRALAIMTG